MTKNLLRHALALGPRMRPLRRLARRLAVFGAATTAVAATAIFPSSQAQAQDRLLLPAEIGIRFNPDGDPGQCGGRTGDQWVTEGQWTDVIRFDTDARAGGCQLAFGVHDPDNLMQGVSMTYGWAATAGADPNQCGNQGVHRMPIRTDARTFGPAIRIDTDDRPGGCTLTFAVPTISTSIVLFDFQYYADGNAAQCPNSLPQGDFRTVDADRGPASIGVDTDSRAGGCRLQVRLRLPL